MTMLMAYPSFITSIERVLEKVGMTLYGVLIAIGLAFFIARFFRVMDASGRSKRVNDWHFFILLLSLIALAGGAWLFDHLFHYLESGTFTGGITYASGFLTGCLAFVLLERLILHTKVRESYAILNLITPGVSLAQVFGRLGCFAAGCCYGKETTSVFGVVFPPSTNAGSDHPGVALHPTQLYESFFCLLLYLALELGGKKNAWIKRHAFPLYLIAYGVFRLVLELFFRGDDRGTLFGVAPSIIVTILMVLLGTALLVFVKTPSTEKSS